VFKLSTLFEMLVLFLAISWFVYVMKMKFVILHLLVLEFVFYFMCYSNNRLVNQYLDIG
jgi:hypothetical protein